MEKVKEELKQLFIEIKNNNKIGYEKLYNRYNKLVYSIAFSILKNKQDSEDVVQIVFSKIYSIDKSKLPIINELSWLYAMTKNEAITFLRRKNDNVDLDSIYEIQSTDDEINKIIDQDSYNRLISKLNDKEKEIISLKILANLSFEEISKILNMPIGTIKWRYYKSLHTLKMLLSNLGMLIVTFLTGIISIKNSKKINQHITTDVSKNETIKEDSINGSLIEDAETEKKENVNRENNEILKDEQNIQQNIIVDTQIQTNNANYIGLSFIGISALFFITTIIFLITFTKHQLKISKKSSK